MTLDELEAQVKRQQELGMTFGLVLTMPIPKSGLRGWRVRTPFGLCEVLSSSRDDARVNFHVSLEKVTKYLARARAAIGSAVPPAPERASGERERQQE